MKKYEEMNIADIIKISKENPSEYLSCLQQGVFSGQLNSYFVELQDRFKRLELEDGFNVGDVYSLLSVDPNFGAEIIYSPWSRNHFIEMLNNYWEGPQVLDIQLGGACNCNCVYCDSPERNRINAVDLRIIQKIIEKGSIKQIYICGLGEPTEKSNLLKLKEILLMAEANDIKVSMFTNLLNMDNELFKHLIKGTLNILYKHDTNDINSMQALYGCSLKEAQTMLENKEVVKKCVCYDSESRTTNVGASIVPTQKNIEEIPNIIEDCIANHIYPLPGELEKAGRANGDSVWNNLALDDKSLLQIKNVAGKHGIHKIDMCPAAALSAHLTNTNFLVTEHTTGSSCPWSILKTPGYEALAFLPEGTDELWYKLNVSREKKLPNNINPWLVELNLLGVAPNIIEDIKKDPTGIIKYLGLLCSAQLLSKEKKDVIGGCGGETREIQKVLSLTALDGMGRRKRNCLQNR